MVYSCLSPSHPPPIIEALIHCSNCFCCHLWSNRTTQNPRYVSIRPLSQMWKCAFLKQWARLPHTDATPLITDRKSLERHWPGLMPWHMEQNIQAPRIRVFCHHSYWEFVLSSFWSFLTWRRKVKLRFTSWLCCSFENKDHVQTLNWKSETTQRMKRKRQHAARILIKHGWSSLDGTAGNRISEKSKMWCILNLIYSYCSHWKLTVFSSGTQKGSERAANESA